MPDMAEQKENIVRFLQQATGEFQNNRNVLNLSPSPLVYQEITQRYLCDISKFTDFPTNAYKKAAYMCFWIRKLKPFHPLSKEQQQANELFAIDCAFAMIEPVHGLRSQTVPIEFLKELIHNLRYRASSPYLIALIFTAMWDYQGIQET